MCNFNACWPSLKACNHQLGPASLDLNLCALPRGFSMRAATPPIRRASAIKKTPSSSSMLAARAPSLFNARRYAVDSPCFGGSQESTVHRRSRKRRRH